MFESLGKIVVSRKGLGLIFAWIGISVLVFAVAPSLESIQRDDNVGFFPKNYPTVIGDNLLQRGFGNDRASSQMVVAVERAEGKFEKADYAFADKLANALVKFRDENPKWGLKPLVTYKTPIIGARLVGTSGSVEKPEGQTILIIQPLESTFIARKTRQALDLLIILVENETLDAPKGIKVGMTGSAMVGHDLNQAANSSMDATTVASRRSFWSAEPAAAMPSRVATMMSAIVTGSSDGNQWLRLVTCPTMQHHWDACKRHTAVTE